MTEKTRPQYPCSQPHGTVARYDARDYTRGCDQVALMSDFLARWRLLFVSFCGHCAACDRGVCGDTGASVKAWHTCEWWREA